MASGRSSLPVLTEAIAGRRIAGSWMADREVHRIHRIWSGLDKYDAVSVALVMGKEVIFDRALAPAVERIASDPARREQSKAQLPSLARRLLEEVEEKGKIRMDRWGVPNNRARPARMVLQEHLLVTSEGIHTERGYHTAIVRPWRASEFSKQFAGSAKSLKLEEAEDRLMLAALRSAVVAQEREVEKWFAFGDSRIEPLIHQGKIERRSGHGKIWLTTAQ